MIVLRSSWLVRVMFWTSLHLPLIRYVFGHPLNYMASRVLSLVCCIVVLLFLFVEELACVLQVPTHVFCLFGFRYVFVCFVLGGTPCPLFAVLFDIIEDCFSFIFKEVPKEKDFFVSNLPLFYIFF